MDIVFCTIGIVVLSPFMLIAALAIKLQDGGPVFYRQKRLTAGGREFDVLKFRSMIVDAEKAVLPQDALASENDPRITKVGKVLRKVRMDELPQMFNILRGDMSIVGPRPERPEIYEACKQTLPDFDLRLRVKAGLTGYAQIYGRYNTGLRDKLNMDLFYIETYSLLQDIRLIFLTIKILFMKDSTQGVILSQEDEANALVNDISSNMQKNHYTATVTERM